MIFIQLLKFEWKYQAKRLSSILFFTLFMMYGILSMISQFQFLEISTMINDGFNLSLLSGLISLGALFPCLFFCVNGILRDRNYRAEEIIFSSGVSKNNFFISRFLIVFGITFLVCLLSVLGVFIGTYLNNSNPEAIHAFNLCHYLWPLLVLILPNSFIIASLLFSITLISRKAIITYIFGVVLIGFYWFSAFTINSPLIGGSTLSSPEIISKVLLIDLFGLAPFFEQTQFLTPVEKNDYLISFSGYFLWNRVLWITLGVLFLLGSYRMFFFRKRNKKVKKKAFLHTKGEDSIPYTLIKTNTDNIKIKILALWSLIKIDFKSTLKSIPFITLLIIWNAMLMFSFHYSTNGVEIYGSRYPTTDLFLGLIIEILPVFGLLLVVFYSGDLVWKTRSHKFNNIIDATPVKNWVFFSSKLIATALIPMTLIVTAITTGIFFQILSGYNSFNISLYLSTFYFGGIQLVLYAVFCLLIQSVLHNKYLGMVISGLIMFLFGPISQNIGLEHPLLLFNNIPSMARTYSDFMGYGHYVSKFNWIALYWASFSGILTLVSYKLWKRGDLISFKKTSNWIFSEKITLSVLLVLFITTGSIIFYNINILNEYSTQAEAYDFHEEYEKKYKKYDSLSVPQLVAVHTELAIFPKKNTYTITAQNRIINSSNTPMKKIFVTAPTPLTLLKINNAKQVFHDSELNTYLFELETPLAPNQELNMEYHLIKKSTAFNINNSISENGSYIKNSDFNPLLGYVNAYEISDPFERKKRKLPPLNNPNINDSHLQTNPKFNYEKVTFETIISTSNDQIAFSSGELIKRWNTDNRNYYHHKSVDKINNIAAYFSANYQVKKIIHKGVNIELYHLPKHHRNVEEMMNITKATINYCIDNFGAYPHTYLRIGEMSTFGGTNGQAMPGVISINENIFRKSNENPESFNAIARVLIHEISHQWWGFLLTPKRIEGALLVSETFAKYSETVILEKLYGKTMVKQLSEHTMRRYFTGRSRASNPEPPLYIAERQQFLGYSKGAIVMNAIREQIGEKQLNTALKRLVTKYRNEETVTSLHFLEELYEVTPKEKHTLIDDWIKRVITYDLSIKEATYKKLNDNTYEVRLMLFVKRYQTNNGKEDEIEINEPIQFGIFRAHPTDIIDVTNETLYLQSHTVNEKEKEYTFIVNEIPKYISVDPYFTKLDRNTSDNTKIILPQ